MHTMGTSCFSWDDSETNLGRRSARGKKEITVSMHSVLSPQQKQTPTEGMAKHVFGVRGNFRQHTFGATSTQPKPAVMVRALRRSAVRRSDPDPTKDEPPGGGGLLASTLGSKVW